MNKEQLKQIIPTPIWRLGSATNLALRFAAQWPETTFHPLRRASIQRLGELKDRHRGQRCFIIGNGPSLKQTDLSKLKNEFTFGMNRIYLGFPEMGFATTYFVSVNSLVIEQSAAEIRALPMPKFVSWRSRNLLYPPGTTAGSLPALLKKEDVTFLHTTYSGPKFARDVRGRVWESATVTNVALQLAYFMGFQTTILIGVDHTYAAQGKPNTTVVSQGADQDHFHAGYFGKGFRWQLPDLDTSEQGYHLAQQAYTEDGRQVLDATVGGKLTIFPKVDYLSLFGSSNAAGSFTAASSSNPLAAK